MQSAEKVATARFAPILGHAMRALRESIPGLTQERLGQKAGLTRETVRRVEAGHETTTTTVDKLLDAMGYDGDDLLHQLQESRAHLKGTSATLRALPGGRPRDAAPKPRQAVLVR